MSRTAFNSSDGTTRIVVEVNDEFVAIDAYDRPHDWKERGRAWRSNGDVGIPRDLVAKVVRAMMGDAFDCENCRKRPRVEGLPWCRSCAKRDSKAKKRAVGQ